MIEAQILQNLRGGYRQEELEAAFAMVQPADNWKNPIDAIVPDGADLALIEFAIGFFAGGGAVIRPVAGGFRVQAPGYYVMIGA